jgi:flagellin
MRLFACILLFSASCQSVRNLKPATPREITFAETEQMMSFLAYLEAYFQSITEIVQRNRVLAVLSANGIYTTEDRMQVDMEFQELLKEIARIHEEARYREYAILNPSNAAWPNNIILKVSNQSLPFYFELTKLDFRNFGLRSWDVNETQGKSDLIKPSSAQLAIAQMDEALSTLANERARIGAIYNRLEHRAKLEHTISQLSK